jgi:hypothetical protein
MPARKNKPGKYGVTVDAKRRKDVQFDHARAEHALVDRLIVQEREDPFRFHYVGWPDMVAARRLEKSGYLVEGASSLGCFRLTDAFRRTFKELSTCASSRFSRDA